MPQVTQSGMEQGLVVVLVRSQLRLSASLSLSLSISSVMSVISVSEMAERQSFPKLTVENIQLEQVLSSGPWTGASPSMVELASGAYADTSPHSYHTHLQCCNKLSTVLTIVQKKSCDIHMKPFCFLK